MNYSAVPAQGCGNLYYATTSHGVSINDNFYLKAAPNNGIYPTLQQAAGNLSRRISQHLSRIHCNLGNLRNLRIEN